MKTYKSVLRSVQETPWAILPAKLADIMEFLEVKAAGGEIAPEDIQAAKEQGKSGADRAYRMFGPLALLSISGTIMHRASFFSDWSGGVSTEALSKSLRGALADPDVKAIVLDIDSPGGTVYGVPEFAEELFRARQTKPVIAQVNDIAASAAYFIASQATEIIVTPSGQVGSIGVLAAHREYSKADEKFGVKTTMVTAGKYKGERNPWEPLSKEAKAALQKEVEQYYEMFVAAVARGRSVPAETVRNGYGEGRMVMAEEALETGMVDRIGTLDETLVRTAVTSSVQPKAQILTIRDFETFLRDAGGFSGRDARTIAESGYKALPGRREAEPRAIDEVMASWARETRARFQEQSKVNHEGENHE